MNKPEINRTVEINKGNCSLETPERIDAYENARAHGWEKDYKEYRRQWVQNPKELVVSDYPLNVDVEVSTACNLRCPMCPLHAEDAANKVSKFKFIDINLYKKIVDELTDNNVPALRLNYRGEPTLHPDFAEMVKYAKGKGIGDLNMTCNGSKFVDSSEFIEKVIPYMDWITFSVDGVYEDYEKVRKPLKFDKIVQMIADIQEYKKKNNLKRPVIKVQSVWPQIDKNYEEYYKIFSEVADSVDYVIERDYAEGWSEKFEYDENFVCAKIYQSFIITVDGLAIPCCVDQNMSYVIGDANKESVHDIWHGDKMAALRKMFEEPNKYKDFYLCGKYCSQTRKFAQPDEIKIGNRNAYVTTRFEPKN